MRTLKRLTKVLSGSMITYAMMIRTHMALGCLAATLAGCSSGFDPRGMELMHAGRFAEASAHVQSTAVSDPSDRRYVLDRKRKIITNLADGAVNDSAQDVDVLYDHLRSQGINDPLPGRVFLGDALANIWKGEPFEQAMGFFYISLADAMRGHWGNSRAAADNSVFLLRDFSSVLTTDDAQLDEQARSEYLADNEQAGQLEAKLGVIAAANRAEERAREEGRDDITTAGSDVFDVAPMAESDFELGYLMQGLAARELKEFDEAEEQLRRVISIAPRLAPVVDRAISGSYNTIYVVDTGFAPEKYRDGPDGAIAMFRPRALPGVFGPQVGTPDLIVDVGPSRTIVPVATDLNRLAVDLRWNNTQDLRIARSYIGTGLVAAGAATALVSDNTAARIAGLSAMAVGFGLKATSGADIRQNELLPQRTYIALLDLPPGEHTLSLSFSSEAAPRLVTQVTSMSTEGPTQVLYARLPGLGVPPPTGSTPVQQLIEGHTNSEPTFVLSPINEIYRPRNSNPLVLN